MPDRPVYDKPVSERRLADGSTLRTYSDGVQTRSDPVTGVYEAVRGSGQQNNYSVPGFQPARAEVTNTNNSVPVRAEPFGLAPSELRGNQATATPVPFGTPPVSTPIPPTREGLGYSPRLVVEEAETTVDDRGVTRVTRFDVVDPADGRVLFSTNNRTDAREFVTDQNSSFDFVPALGSPTPVTAQGQGLVPTVIEINGVGQRDVPNDDIQGGDIGASQETVQNLPLGQGPVNPGLDDAVNQGLGQGVGTPYDDTGNLNPGWFIGPDGVPTYSDARADEINPAAAAARQALQIALGQRAAADKLARKTAPDWRFRLSLAPGAGYLYKDPRNILLNPLAQTNGVVFPYTPKVDLSYNANYDPYDLVHTNYRGYFYRQSQVSEINLDAVFTAQSTSEADYLLAVIHFFRSATKMFYGNDRKPVAGTPPPVCFLTGLGSFQFNNHPVLISSFNYSLPNDVDYIRANSQEYEGGLTPLNNIRNQFGSRGGPGGLIDAVTNRLVNAGLDLIKDALGSRSTSIASSLSRSAPPRGAPVTGYPSYVPTKISISLKLLPVISRWRQANDFSLKDYADGTAQDRGIW